MSRVRISSPTAAAAFVLLDLLSEHGATASSHADGSWEVEIAVKGTGPANLAFVLSAARDWLDSCGLSVTHVTVGGETHLLQARSPAPRQSVP